MRFGMNLLLWSAELHDGLLPTIEQLKKIGYDGVEIPMFSVDISSLKAWGERLDNLGLGRTAVTVRGADDNPISPDPACRQRGVEQTKRVLDGCHACGCTHLVGPLHSALGIFSGKGPTRDEWQWGLEGIRKVAEHAAAAGVILGIEPLNRFENYFLTNHADAARFAREVNHPNCRIMYDTFHAHIEEKNPANALIECRDMVTHIHVSENDRSTPGSGAVAWGPFFSAVKQIGYDGWLMVEAFGLALPELAAATKIWRKMFASEEQLSRDAYVFMRKHTA
jgi:D-psicose/D-tagatose/L-ribulose 3-epimerase